MSFTTAHYFVTVFTKVWGPRFGWISVDMFFSICQPCSSVKVVLFEFVGNNTEGVFILPVDLVNVPSYGFV